MMKTRSQSRRSQGLLRTEIHDVPLLQIQKSTSGTTKKINSNGKLQMETQRERQQRRNKSTLPRAGGGSGHRSTQGDDVDGEEDGGSTMKRACELRKCLGDAPSVDNKLVSSADSGNDREENCTTFGEEEAEEKEEEEVISDTRETGQQKEIEGDIQEKGSAVSEEETDNREDDKDDSDDAPDDVSFSKSRSDALEVISQASQQAKRSEEQAKEKRRKRDKLLKMQKQRKAVSLHHARLPEDFLSDIAQPAEKVSKDIQKTKKSEKTPKHHKFLDCNEEMSFIPISPAKPRVVHGFEVRATMCEERAPPPKSHSALKFLQKQMYGSKVKRESVETQMSRLLKRKGQPGLVFVAPKGKKRKKNLGEKKGKLPDR